LAGVLWICAGRDVNELGKRMREHGAYEPFGEEGLPVLTDGDLREILDKECGRQIYELIVRDRPDAPPNGNSNPFLEALVERSQGLPLYLRLVVQDIREGELSFKEGEEKRLARGLASYYERVLERLQISDVAAVLTPVFCVLACAKAPLTIETLLELMRDDRLIREGGEELLRKALEFGHLMLKRVTITEQRNVGEEGEPFTAPAYVLYHESFRDHLLATETVKYAVRAARTGLAEISIGWSVIKEHLFSFRYALRYGPQHLTEQERWGELESILTDLVGFIPTKCAAGMTYDLITDYTLAVNTLPEAQDMLAEGRKRKESVAQHVKNLIGFSKGQLSGLDILPSVEIWGNKRIETELLRLAHSTAKLDRLRAFSAFVRSEGSHLAMFGGHPGFCVQQAYNSAAMGPVSEHAEYAVQQQTQAGMLLLLPHCREYNPMPAQRLVLQGHSDSVEAAAMTSDGMLGISAGRDHVLRVWDLETGACRRVLEGHADVVSTVALTPDGRTAISGSHDHTIRVWDLQSGVCERILEGHAHFVESVAILPDARIAVSGSSDRTIRLWNLETGTCLHVLEGHTDAVHSVVVTADGRTVVSASRDHTLRIWDPAQGHSICVTNEATQYNNCLSLTLDGRRAITGNHNWNLQIWDRVGRVCQYSLEGHTDSVSGVALAADGRLAISSSLDKTLRVWDLELRKCLRVLRGHADMVNGVALSADGCRALSAGCDHTLRVWDVEKGYCNSLLKGHKVWVEGVAVTPDRRRVVSASMDKTLRVWDVQRWACERVLEGHEFWVLDVAVTADGKRAISGGFDKTVRLWDLDNGECVSVLHGHTDLIWSVAITQDGKLAFSGGGDGDRTVRVWDLETGECLKVLQGHVGPINCVAVTPSGGLLASAGGNENGPRIWNWKTGECRRLVQEDNTRYQGAVDWMQSVALSRNGRLAVSSSGSVICIWDIESGLCQIVLAGHTLAITNVLFGEDGGRVVSTSLDGTVRVWSLQTRECLAIMAWHDQFTGAAIADDGFIVVSTHGGKILGAEYSMRSDRATAMPSQRFVSGLQDPGNPGRLAERFSLASLASSPHPSANAERAARLNIQFIEAMKKWRALPWWKRIHSKRPERPTGI